MATFYTSPKLVSRFDLFVNQTHKTLESITVRNTSNIGMVEIRFEDGTRLEDSSMGFHTAVLAAKYIVSAQSMTFHCDNSYQFIAFQNAAIPANVTAIQANAKKINRRIKARVRRNMK